MFCPNCGKSIPEDVNFCPYCGENIEEYLRLKEDLHKKGKETASQKDERKGMRIEDIFNTKKPETAEVQKEDPEKEDYEKQYREEIKEIEEKEENIDETIFRLDPLEETRIHAAETEEDEEAFSETEVQKESAISKFFLKYKNNKFLNGINKAGKKVYRSLITSQEKLYEKTKKPIHKLMHNDKILLGIIIIFALFLLLPLFLHEKSLTITNSSFGSYIVIILLAAFDGLSSFLILTVAQYAMQTRFKEKPLKDEVFKYSLYISAMIAVIRFIIYLITDYLVVIDSILMAKPLGAHPILFIILWILGIYGLLSLHWKRYEKKDYLAVLGLACGGALITGVLMFLMGSTIFRVLIVGLAPHIIN